MEPWAWLAAYLVGFAFLQLLLYRYFREESSRHDQRTSGGSMAGGGDRVRPRTDGGAASQADDTVYCNHCGARNERDPAFTFCRKCASPLQ